MAGGAAGRGGLLVGEMGSAAGRGGGVAGVWRSSVSGGLLGAVDSQALGCLGQLVAPWSVAPQAMQTC